MANFVAVQVVNDYGSLVTVILKREQWESTNG
jgi:hypothetical protein